MSVLKNEKIVENIKTASLVVLLLFTILLLYLLWGGRAFPSLGGNNAPQTEAINAAEILQPDRIEMCFGGGSYTVTDNKFGEMIDCFKALSASRDLSVEEISKERYTDVMRLPSIKAVFNYYVPFNAMCEANGIDRIPGADALDAVSELGYAAAYDDRFYVFDNKTDKYYRIIGNRNSRFEVLKNEIIEAEKDSIDYFPLSMIVGGVENDTLCPISFNSDIYNIAYYPEDFSSQPEKTNALIRGFFSDNFDFVRRIEQESGTLVYMYGYGRIVVTAHNNGVLEFKREEDERTAQQIKYLDALNLSNSFIAAHGAFTAESGETYIPYIKEVIADPDGKKGFRFIFGIKAGGVRVYYEGGAPVTIDVTGGRVSYFKRGLISIDQNEPGDRNGREVFSAINVLAGNYEYMGEPSIEQLVEKVTGFDCGYVKNKRNSNNLTAAWVVFLGNREFYFGLDDGKPVGGAI